MAMPQLDESKMRLVQELEIEMMTDMYSRQFYAQKVDMSSRQFLCTVDRYVQQVVLWTVDGHVQQVVLYEQNIEMYIRLIYVQQADLLVYIQHLSIECSSASRERGGGDGAQGAISNVVLGSLCLVVFHILLLVSHEYTLYSKFFL